MLLLASLQGPTSSMEQTQTFPLGRPARTLFGMPDSTSTRDLMVTTNGIPLFATSNKGLAEAATPMRRDWTPSLQHLAQAQLLVLIIWMNQDAATNPVFDKSAHEWFMPIKIKCAVVECQRLLT